MAMRPIPSPPPFEPNQVHLWQVRPSRDRAAVRAILGLYLDEPADHVEMVSEGAGKPRLARHRGVRFNASHGDGLTLVAVALGREVGVDVERIDPRRATERIARRFFAHDELVELERLPHPERITGFYRCWTAKEAYVKALGTGLARPLDDFVVSASVEPPELISDREDPDAPTRWRLARPSLPDGYAGCVASEGELELLPLSWPA